MAQIASIPKVYFNQYEGIVKTTKCYLVLRAINLTQIRIIKYR